MSRRLDFSIAGLISITFLIGGLVPTPVRELLRWSREAPTIEWLWRSWCAHWLHLDLTHALLNIAGFFLVFAWLSNTLTKKGWLVVSIVSIISIDLSLWWLTDFEWYVGSSALIHAIAAVGIAVRVADGERVALAVALVGLLKLAFEQLSDTTTLISGTPIAIDAHLIGAASGVICGLVFASTGWCRPRSVTLS
ncbi:MAG: rhombosortase [Steroidobacteraceae bacterium]